MQRPRLYAVYASNSSPKMFSMLRLSTTQLAVLPLFLFFFGASTSAQEHAPSDFFGQRLPCKVFIGVGTSIVSGGLKVDYTVDNTPARTYGVRAGDVILALDGVPVRTQSELTRERDKHQQGDAFALSILREGSEMTINAKFKTCSAEELEAAKQKQEEMQSRLVEKEFRMLEKLSNLSEHLAMFDTKDRPILGVYEDTDVNAEGMVIRSLVRGKGAEAAGLQAGDVIIRVNGKPVTGSVTLRDALGNHKPGDQVDVAYLRGGQNLKTALILSGDRQYYTHKVERDPCKVFIGVYTTGHAFEGRGARVSGVIDGTPAKESGVQPGDIILELNGVPVSNHLEILTERDKNKPGDAFTLTVLREGAMIFIDSRFKSCDKQGAVPVEETVELASDEAEEREPIRTDNTLALEVFEAYPSPTFGPLNIQFEAEALPTTVRIFDVSGKAVYNKELPQFGGSFNEQVNLANNKAGNYVLSIQQGNKLRSKQIVLMPRA